MRIEQAFGEFNLGEVPEVAERPGNRDTGTPGHRDTENYGPQKPATETQKHRELLLLRGNCGTTLQGRMCCS